MSQAKEPKEHNLKVRRGFTVGGTKYNKGEVFKTLIIGWFVKDGIEIAELQPEGAVRPTGIPAEFFCFEESDAE
jgi:hypothetical protein